MHFENLSRRSFLKRTTVLTVGIAATTLFSGLVDAAVSQYGKKTPSSTCKDADKGGNPSRTFYFTPAVAGANPHCYREYQCTNSSGGHEYCQFIYTSGVGAGTAFRKCDKTSSGGNACASISGVTKKDPGVPW